MTAPLSNSPVPFSPQPTDFWYCLWRRSGLTLRMQHLQLLFCRDLRVVALGALTPASVHSLWSSPKFLNIVCLTFLSRQQSPLFLVHLFPETLFSSSELLFNRLAVHRVKMTFCSLHSVWTVLMLVICTTLKSVVFPMTVVMCTEPDRDAQYLHCSNLIYSKSAILIIWQ